MKIDFCSIKDPLDLNSWSGLSFFIRQSLLAQSADVSAITGFQPKHSTSLKIRFRASKMLGKNFYYDLTNDYCRQYAKQLEEKITDPAAIVFTTNSQLVSFFSLSNKVVIYNDATFKNLYGIYDYFSDLTSYDQREVFRNEKKAFQRADLLLFASKWAADSAIHDYDIDPFKVHVVPFGANLANPPTTSEVEKMISIRMTRKECNLLFVGVDFERKGGEQAVAVANSLYDMGIPVKLVMLGMKDFSKSKLPEFVIDGGFLDKAIPHQRMQLEKCFREADFFLMPTQRECYGLVFTEAFAYGLPVLACDTGGVSSIVTHGYNGWLFNTAADAVIMAKAIAACFAQPGEYQGLATNARHSFEQTYNWETAGSRIIQLLRQL